MNIKDIAKIAQVSVATVSRVINGNENVKKSTKEKIEKIIKENNYVPSSVGITMLKKKSNVIGIVLPIVHSYYTERFNAISKVLSERAYSTLISVSNYDTDKEIEILSDFLKRQVDGVIFMTTKFTEEFDEILGKYSKTPLIFLDADGTGSGFSSIIFDDYGGAKKGIQYLIQCGHKKIGFIGGGGTNPYSKSNRYRAYEDVLSENGIKIDENQIVYGDYSLKSGYELIDKLLEKSMPSAIYCTNDNMAIGAARRIYELGYKIPEDISVMGTDNIEPVKYMCPASLTTIKQDLYGSGELAGKMILRYLDEENTDNELIKLEQELIIRESVKILRP